MLGSSSTNRTRLDESGKMLVAFLGSLAMGFVVSENAVSKVDPAAYFVEFARLISGGEHDNLCLEPFGYSCSASLLRRCGWCGGILRLSALEESPHQCPRCGDCIGRTIASSIQYIL